MGGPGENGLGEYLLRGPISATRPGRLNFADVCASMGSCLRDTACIHTNHECHHAWVKHAACDCLLAPYMQYTTNIQVHVIVPIPGIRWLLAELTHQELLLQDWTLKL